MPILPSILYIHRPIPFPQVHMPLLAHSYIMVQLLPWAIVHSYTTIYTIYPQPIPFPWVHTILLAHPYIMVQLLLWAHMGWPVSIATLSPSAARLRWVNSLNGLA